jgi:hypothetical protein
MRSRRRHNRHLPAPDPLAGHGLVLLAGARRGDSGGGGGVEEVFREDLHLQFCGRVEEVMGTRDDAPFLGRTEAIVEGGLLCLESGSEAGVMGIVSRAPRG